MPDVHPQGDLGLAAVPAEVPLPDQQAEQEADREVRGRGRGILLLHDVSLACSTGIMTVKHGRVGRRDLPGHRSPPGGDRPPHLRFTGILTVKQSNLCTALPAPVRRGARTA